MPVIYYGGAFTKTCQGVGEGDRKREDSSKVAMTKSIGGWLQPDSARETFRV